MDYQPSNDFSPETPDNAGVQPSAPNTQPDSQAGGFTAATPPAAEPQGQPAAPVFPNNNQPPAQGYQPPAAPPVYPGNAPGYPGAAPQQPPYGYSNYTPPAQPPYNAGYPPQYPYTPAPQQSGPGKTKAIISLVLGIFAIVFGTVFFYLGIPASIVGIILATQARKEMPQNGNGMAVAGLVVSIVGLVFSLLSGGCFWAIYSWDSYFWNW